MNYLVTVPHRAKPIGRYWPTTIAAIQAAKRAAKRYGGHAYVRHWRDNPTNNPPRYTVFDDGSVIEREINAPTSED